METGLSKELAAALKTQIAEGEDWLIKRILYYAKQQGYTAYTSTLEEAWRASITGLSKPLLDTPVTSFQLMELHPHFDFKNDHYAAFGVEEAKRHRERGINLIMFLSLFKYYRQTYEDLLFKVELPAEEVQSCRIFLKRYFDRVELGFLDEWMRVDAEGINRELGDANVRLTNEKSLYLTTLESLKQPVVVVNSSGETVVMNEAAAELFAGKSSPGAVYYGGQRAEISHSVKKRIMQFLDDYKESKSFSHQIDGRIFDITFSRMKDVSGKFLGLAVILNDITDKRRAESVLEESETLRRAIMEGIDAAALVLDMESQMVVDFNSNMTALFTAKITEKGFGEDFPVFYEEPGGVGASVFELAENSVSNEERLLDLGSGRMKPVRLFSMEVWFQNRRHRILIIFDISREKMLEKRANHLQHLEILGDLAGALPFMIKESVHSIQNSLEQFSDSVCNAQSFMHLMPSLAKALGDASYVNEIICAMEPIVQYEQVTAHIDMNQLLKNCVVLTRSKWGPYAEIDMRPSEGGGTVFCRPDEMGQVFLNLLVNAGYAVRKKYEADSTRGLISIKSRYSAGFFELRIADNGVGIKKKDYKRIFDYGNSSGEVGRATGSGLATIYDLVVRRYGGTIEFKSEENKGSVFVIRIPSA